MSAQNRYALQAILPGIGQRFFCGYTKVRYYKPGSVNRDTPTNIRPCRVIRVRDTADKAFSYRNWSEASKAAQELANTHRMPFAVFDTVMNVSDTVIMPQQSGGE